MFAPKLVKLDEVTPVAKLEPVKVPAAAVTVQVEPSVHPVPLTVTRLFASKLFGIDEMPTRAFPLTHSAICPAEGDPLIPAPMLDPTISQFVPFGLS
jgi:hypothetical protein